MQRRSKSKVLLLLLVGAVFLVWRFVDFAIAKPKAVGGAAQAVSLIKKAERVRKSVASLDNNVDPKTSPVSEEAGEVINSHSDCETICGVACDRNSAGKLICPPACIKDSDCGAEALCAPTAVGVWRCLASDCKADSDCSNGGSCIYEAHTDRGVRRCKEAGKLESGAVCGIEAGSCKQGLSCLEGMCLPATCNTSTDCPKSSTCAPMAGPERVHQCMPACKDDADCPEGRTCHQIGQDRTACTEQFDAKCLSEGCSKGYKCQILDRSPVRILAECLKSCTSDTSCGDGAACVEISQTAGQVNEGCLPLCKQDADCKTGQACEWFPSLALGSKVCGLSHKVQAQN